jgi:competence protein ComEA
MQTITRSSIRSLFFAALLASGAVWADAVDINHADAATIAKELKGIGPARAQAIVEYREKHGAFKSADDLTKIKGVGAKVIEKNRANIRVGEAKK